MNTTLGPAADGNDSTDKTTDTYLYTFYHTMRKLYKMSNLLKINLICIKMILHFTFGQSSYDIHKHIVIFHYLT